MPVLTSNFNKILVQRLGGRGKEMKVTSNVNIKDIAKTEIRMGEIKASALKFSFDFITKYQPDHAEIILEGDVIYQAPAAKVDAIANTWKKDKKSDKDVTTEVVNHLLSRCNIEALFLSRELNLPSPIPMPHMGPKKK